jgi:hypothetical protein
MRLRALALALLAAGCGSEHAVSAHGTGDGGPADATVDHAVPPTDATVADAEEDAPTSDATSDVTPDPPDAGMASDATDEGMGTDAAACPPDAALTATDAGGPCNAFIQSWPDEGHTHLPEGTSILYCTEPPSSGDHYPVWANYTTYTKPVAAPYLVHDLEHGAIVITYPCASSCPNVASALQAVIDAHPLDPMCSNGIASRLILAPDPTLDVPVAAAAWQWTYRATCVDSASLTAFINAHYAQAAENTCAPGIVPP